MGIFGVIIGIIVLVVYSASKPNGDAQKRLTTINPKLVVEAVLVAKRTNFANSNTTYYFTFQFESGDRTEFAVSGPVYGQFIEGDYGRLMFQGRKFIMFERTPFISTNKQ